MQVKAIKELISQGESERLEMKLSAGHRTEAVKTVCGILNNLGGYLFLGSAIRLIWLDRSEKRGWLKLTTEELLAKYERQQTEIQDLRDQLKNILGEALNSHED